MGGGVGFSQIVNAMNQIESGSTAPAAPAFTPIQQTPVTASYQPISLPTAQQPQVATAQNQALPQMSSIPQMNPQARMLPAAQLLAQQPAQPYVQQTSYTQPQQGAQSTFTNPYRQVGSNSTLRVPGFQGVANPFYTVPPAQPAPTHASAQDLLSQYNAYRQKNAEALYQSRTAQLAQAQAMQKAYADAQAAAKAKAEAEAVRAKTRVAFASPAWYAIQSGYKGLNKDDFEIYAEGAVGGIASLQRGFKR